MVPVKEDFDAYAPPSWGAPTVGRLLDSLLPEHFVGLSSIVLTESAKTSAAFFACGLVMDRSPRDLSERLRGASTERRRAE